MRHIREAEELSRELGGTDADVKEYFFSLPPFELRLILEDYERQYGRVAREYAEDTMPAWRSGRRKMSGQNASRLFHLLPRFMPLERKYALVETLWNKFAPHSEYSVSFGPKADVRAISDVVRDHLSVIVSAHKIPENLERRFNWLADGDSNVMQQLLNHFLMSDSQRAIEVATAIIGLLLPHAHNGDALQCFQRKLKVGGHAVHVFFDPRATEVKLAVGTPRYISKPDYAWIGVLIVVAVIVAVIWFFKSKSSKSERPTLAPSYKQRR